MKINCTIVEAVQWQENWALFKTAIIHWEVSRGWLSDNALATY
jgi:hypothetical protein